jgi:hypothetical protein
MLDSRYHPSIARPGEEYPAARFSPYGLSLKSRISTHSVGSMIYVCTECSHLHVWAYACAKSASVEFQVTDEALCCKRYVFVLFKIVVSSDGCPYDDMTVVTPSIWLELMKLVLKLALSRMALGRLCGLPIIPSVVHPHIALGTPVRYAAPNSILTCSDGCPSALT